MVPNWLVCCVGLVGGVCALVLGFASLPWFAVAAILFYMMIDAPLREFKWDLGEYYYPTILERFDITLRLTRNQRINHINTLIDDCEQELRNVHLHQEYKIALERRITELEACRFSIQQEKERKNRDKVLDKAAKTVRKELKWKS